MPSLWSLYRGSEFAFAEEIRRIREHDEFLNVRAMELSEWRTASHFPALSQAAMIPVQCYSSQEHLEDRVAVLNRQHQRLRGMPETQQQTLENTAHSKNENSENVASTNHQSIVFPSTPPNLDNRSDE